MKHQATRSGSALARAKDRGKQLLAPVATRVGLAPAGAADGQAGPLVTALFLSALADWADEKVTDDEGLKRRQLPIVLLLQAFGQMSLVAEDSHNHLSLETLMGDIARRSPEVINSIVTGFVRAGLADLSRPWRYKAPRHMQSVFQRFAALRAARIKAKEPMPDPDPYIAFATRVYCALIATGKKQGPIAADFIIDKSRLFLSNDDINSIRTGARSHSNSVNSE